jgi:uncharacterized protein (DUF2235 family)
MTTQAPKNIILCSDGTGNRAIKGRGTNVFKLFESLDLHTHEHAESIRQVAFYDDGVGTEKLKLLKILGGAFGVGLGRNVRQLYTELVRVYNPGDRIFLFGFSRGAFTVRTLAGLIVGCGIIDRSGIRTERELKKRVVEAYEAYRYRYAAWLQMVFRNPKNPLDRQAVKKRAAEKRAALREKVGVHPIPDPEKEKLIRFIGVWDTVAAVGLPFDEATKFINRAIYRFSFPDQRLSPLVKRACHALAIDDERRTFHPTLWDHRDNDHDRIEQVWFPGVHSNVGGGYPKQGVSLVALDWMMHRADAAGLRFHPGVRKTYHEQQNVNDKLYDSRAGGGLFYRYLPRDISSLCNDHNCEPRLHDSVRDRAVNGTAGYAPGNLPVDAQLVTTRPLPTPLSRDQEAFLAALRAQVTAGTSFLGSMQRFIRLRHYSHLAFVLGVVATVVFAVWRGMAASGAKIFEVMGDMMTISGIMAAVKDPLIWPWLAAIAVLLAVALYARKRMEAAFSQNWFSVRRTLDGGG